MNRIAFITYAGFELLDVAGPVSVFNGANRALGQRSRPPFYETVLASAQGGPVASSSGVTLQTRRAGELQPAEIQTLLVVGAEREPLLKAVADPVLQSAVLGLANSSQRFGSICTGGFLLAALGLLDGQRVATHWDACEPFAASFKTVTVDPEALYVVDGKLWTSAGVTTGIDMALAMVSADLGAPVASEVAKRLVLYARRPGYQSQFSPVLQAQAKADSPFGELIGWMLENLDAPLDVRSLAESAGMTERTFYRRFLAAVGETPARFVETARLDAARMLLSRGQTLKSVAAQVGLYPPSRLADAFERRFGVTPMLFREMHGEP